MCAWFNCKATTTWRVNITLKIMIKSMFTEVAKTKSQSSKEF